LGGISLNILVLLALFFIPESAVFKYEKGDFEGARKILK
jgi:hypothetical protein